jgi:hypothetical protein
MAVVAVNAFFMFILLTLFYLQIFIIKGYPANNQAYYLRGTNLINSHEKRSFQLKYTASGLTRLARPANALRNGSRQGRGREALGACLCNPR